jgi:hypothetical protein
MRALRLLLMLAPLALGGCTVAATVGPGPVYGYGYHGYGYYGRPYGYPPRPWYGPRPYRPYGWGYGRPWYRH